MTKETGAEEIQQDEGARVLQISRNMFSRTPRFMAAGLPFSSSTPDSPPSPARPAIFRRSSSSSSDWGFFSDLACSVTSASPAFRRSELIVVDAVEEAAVCSWESQFWLHVN